jgi:predicted phosphodiesterase
VRYLILSDIHSNLHALTAALDSVRKRKFQRILVLGDLVGYGAFPNETVQTVLALKKLHAVIRGNHDRVSVAVGEDNSFNLPAMAAILWTREHLTPDVLQALKNLKPGPVLVEDFSICHGSPLDEDLYILSDREAWFSFQAARTDLTFFGHSHVPCWFTMKNKDLQGFLVDRDYFHLKLKEGTRYLINPGSVGQPRDGNPRASYCLYDSRWKTVTFFRVPYDVAGAQNAILNSGLPPNLAHRLKVGM